MLPLFAIMLGNDFISRRWFSKFYKNVTKRKVNKKKNLSPQQKRILTLLSWLQHETLHSAIRKILECVKQYQRPKLWHQIRTAMSGYRMEESKSFEYFGFKDDLIETQECNFLDLTLDEIMAHESEESEQEEEEEEEEERDSENENPNEEVEDEEEQIDDENDEEEKDGFEVKESGDEDFIENVETDEEEVVTVEVYQRKHFVFPSWFVNLYQSGATPRFPVDLLRSHRYINYPQVEDFSANDSNTISYPILNMLYSLMHAPRVPRLYYYTRIVKQVRYEIIKIESDVFPIVDDFDPNQKKNVKFLKRIFERSFTNIEEIFTKIQEIPEAHQLFILAVIFWIKRSSSTDLKFLCTLILSLISINVIDKKCEKIHRDNTIFQKKYEKNIKELKAKEVIAPEESFNDVPLKSIFKNVTKHEALITMEGFVNHFTLSSKFMRKHADFNRKIVHTFSEFQSVAYNLYAINSFLNYPFENIKIENYFNGLFLYNMYLNLKSRSNSLEYIKFHLFKHSTALRMIFCRIFDICIIALPYLTKELTVDNQNASKGVKKIRKPKNSSTKVAKPQIENDCIKNDSSDDAEFEDLNNKFSQLLKNID